MKLRKRCGGLHGKMRRCRRSGTGRAGTCERVLEYRQLFSLESLSASFFMALLRVRPGLFPKRWKHISQSRHSHMMRSTLFCADVKVNVYAVARQAYLLIALFSVVVYDSSPAKHDCRGDWPCGQARRGAAQSLKLCSTHPHNGRGMLRLVDRCQLNSKLLILG